MVAYGHSLKVSQTKRIYNIDEQPGRFIDMAISTEKLLSTVSY